MSDSKASSPEKDADRQVPPVADVEPVDDTDRDAPGTPSEREQPPAGDAASELETLRAELQAADDRVLRAQAELENYRKRMRREMEDSRRYAILPLVRDLLPVVDNIDRAIAAAAETDDGSGLLAGVRMVASQLHAALERHHCRRIEADGRAFDPALHEAVSQQATDEHPEGTVLQVVQPGYTLHDRVVRPAQVVVAAARGEREQ